MMASSFRAKYDQPAKVEFKDATIIIKMLRGFFAAVKEPALRHAITSSGGGKLM